MYVYNIKYAYIICIHTQAWGHGMKVNPLPRRLNRTDPGPMRDRTVFRTGTTIPRLPMSLQPVTK